MKRISLLWGHPPSYSMRTGGAFAGRKAGSMMLTTDFYLVQRLIMRAARTFPVITTPQVGFRLDFRLVSVITRLCNVQLQRSNRGSTINGRCHAGSRIAGDLSASNRKYMTRNEGFHTVDGLVSRRQNCWCTSLSLEVRDASGTQQNLAAVRELSEWRQSPWWLEAHTYEL